MFYYLVVTTPPTCEVPDFVSNLPAPKYTRPPCPNSSYYQGGLSEPRLAGEQNGIDSDTTFDEPILER